MVLQDVLNISISNEEYLKLIRERVNEKYKKKGYTLKERGVYLKNNLPQLKNKIIEEANRYLNGMHLLPGTGNKPYFVGNPPDWFSNPVRHNEYVFHLNRMNHWRILLAAYTITENKSYAEKVIVEFKDWIEKCPRPNIDIDIDKVNKSFNSVNGWRSLEAGIRTYKNWPWFIDYLINTEFITPEILEKFVVSMHEHGEVLAEVCPLFWPKADHNHFLMENLGLLTLSCMFPELKKAKEWKNQAMRDLERCASAQITSEGGQIEGCPSYHNGCVKWFSISLLLARDYNLQFSSEYVEKIKKSLDYSMYSFRPSGTGVPWGDSSTNKGAIVSSIYGFIAFNNTNWIKFVTRLSNVEDVKKECIDKFWVVPDIEELFNVVETVDSSKAEFSLPRVSWQKQLKQAAIRTDWSKEALSVLFACRTPIQNNHAHIDPMGFDFTALGKPLVVDPGKFTYREDENRKNFKSVYWHNTLTIDNKSPFEYFSSWEYGSQKFGNITKVVDKGSFMYAEAVHYNYEPCIHKRIISIKDNKFLLVIDKVENLNKDSSVQIYYHIDSSKVFIDVENSFCHSCDKDVNVAIYSVSSLKGNLHSAKVSDKNDVARDSIIFCLEDKPQENSGNKERYYAAVIVPYKGQINVPKVKKLEIINTNEDVVCTFELDNNEYNVIWNDEGLNYK